MKNAMGCVDGVYYGFTPYIIGFDPTINLAYNVRKI